MNPVMVQPSTSRFSSMPLLFQQPGAGATVVGILERTTLYRLETTREGTGTVFHAFGIGTSPKQEAMMWLADDIRTSPGRGDAFSLTDGIGTSPDHERS